MKTRHLARGLGFESSTSADLRFLVIVATRRAAAAALSSCVVFARKFTDGTAAILNMLEIRTSLLQEGRHPFVEIAKAEGRVIQRLLHGHPGIQVAIFDWDRVSES